MADFAYPISGINNVTLPGAALSRKTKNHQIIEIKSCVKIYDEIINTFDGVLDFTDFKIDIGGSNHVTWVAFARVCEGKTFFDFVDHWNNLKGYEYCTFDNVKKLAGFNKSKSIRISGCILEDSNKISCQKL